MTRARLHEFLEWPLSPEEIERESLRRIAALAGAHGFGPDEWVVARRLVHTSGDLEVLAGLQFQGDALRAGVAALRRGAPLYFDASMARAGIAMARLQRVQPSYSASALLVHVGDEDVREQSLASRLPRAIYALRKARAQLDGAVVCFGNSPVGLLELNRMVLEEGVRPALVLGMPVGLVHVEESKDELLTLPVPAITLRGRRGGSPLVVATIHALTELALAEQAP